MDLMSGLRLIIVASGVGVAVYGVWILITGRALRGEQRAFRGRTDAGLYHLCFGLALALLALGQIWNEHQTLPAAATLIAIVALIGLGIRYRPRRDKRR